MRCRRAHCRRAGSAVEQGHLTYGRTGVEGGDPVLAFRTRHALHDVDRAVLNDEELPGGVTLPDENSAWFDLPVHHQ